MSLDDLLANYSPARPVAERCALLEAMAARLPAPEFLWYELAVQALHGDEDALKEPALALLAHAPRSWHQVLMVALTESEPAVQTAALKALYAHALEDPERRVAFGALGELPGWREESLALWHALSRALAAPPIISESVDEAPPTVPLRPPSLTLPSALQNLPPLPDLDIVNAELDEAQAAIERLEGRILELEDENFLLREDRARLGTAFEGERRRADALACDLAALRERHEELHAELLDQVEHLKIENEQRDRHYRLAVTGLESALDQSRTRQRRTLTAGLLSLAVVAAIGGPLAYSFAAHSSVMAMSPEDLPAGRHSAGAVGQRKGDAGYVTALARLTAEAKSLEDSGHLEQALAIWQAAARIAATPADAAAAQKAAEQLTDRLEPQGAAIHPKPAAPEHSAATHGTHAHASAQAAHPRTPTVARPVVKAVAPVFRAPSAVSVHATKPAAQPHASAGLTIPAAIRAKF